MSTFGDINITEQSGKFHVTENPGHTGPNGIVYWNRTSSVATINMTSVPGFQSVTNLTVPAKDKRIAERTSSPSQAGDYHYSIVVANLTPSTPSDASPRVILDLFAPVVV